MASFLPPFSPFVMLARLMVGAVPPWQVCCRSAILVGGIVAVAVIATRMYAAGVLLYGQRPGIRAFMAAAPSARRGRATSRRRAGSRLISARTGAAAGPAPRASPRRARPRPSTPASPP